jgi:hypothetical protein
VPGQLEGSFIVRCVGAKPAGCGAPRPARDYSDVGFYRCSIVIWKIGLKISGLRLE